MKNLKIIIDVQTKEEIIFTKDNLPMMIHGVEGSGSSLLSLSILAEMYKERNKILMFTAYSMAKEEFLNQVDNDTSEILFLENESGIERAAESQTIMVQSGNQELLKNVFSALPDISKRIIFIKNIETVTNLEILEKVPKNLLIISGDINMSQEVIKNLEYKTKILFSSLDKDLNSMVELQKYQALMFTDSIKKIISLNNI